MNEKTAPDPHKAEPRGEEPTDDESADVERPIVQAENLSLTAKRGSVYAPVSFSLLASQGIAAIVGPRGSGKTSLLLTLAGRMKPDAGSRLEVFGYELPRQRSRVQKLAAVANMPDVDDPDGATTIASHLREHLGYLTPWYATIPKPSPEALKPAFGELPIPPLASPIRDLSPLDAALVRISLALIQKPKLLLIDNIDDPEADADRSALALRLASLSDSGIAVIAASTDLAQASALSSTIVSL